MRLFLLISVDGSSAVLSLLNLENVLPSSRSTIIKTDVSSVNQLYALGMQSTAGLQIGLRILGQQSRQSHAFTYLIKMFSTWVSTFSPVFPIAACDDVEF
jgi:hypothetical protein